MAGEIFVDTGAWVALADTRDNFHEAAGQAYPLVLRQWRQLITTNLVIAETYNLIRRRLGHAAGIQFLESLQKSPRLVKVYSNNVFETQAETILRRYADQDFSLTDAVSFAVMQDRKISEAFAFDYHFALIGFSLFPARS